METEDHFEQMPHNHGISFGVESEDHFVEVPHYHGISLGLESEGHDKEMYPSVGMVSESIGENVEREPPTTTTIMSIENGRHELPTEMLRMVLTGIKPDLVKRGRPESDKREEPLLKLRSVNPTWKIWVDDVLEKNCLDFWIKWNPNQDHTILNPYAFPILRVTSHRWKAHSLEAHQCPKFVRIRNSKNYNPFPTKSVCITEGEPTKKYKTSNRLSQYQLFEKWGHHLTSLTIFSVENFHVITLAQIAKCTPNLKAIALQELNLWFPSLTSEVQVEFPKLKQLQHVLIFPSNDVSYYKIYNSILKPHQEQLLSIQMSYDGKTKETPTLLNFPKLERLKIWYPQGEFFTTSLQLPNLLHFSLGCVNVGVESHSLEQILKFISRLPTALVDLHLDINSFWYFNLTTYSEMFPKTLPKYRKLKSFTTFYPKRGLEFLFVKDLLKMFPNLETLKLIMIEGTEFMPNITQYQAVQNLLRREEYREICTKLKTIEVYNGRYDNIPFISVDFDQVFIESS